MILGMGTDIISNERIASALSRHGEKFTKRLFSEKENKYFRELSRKRAEQSIGGAFAAKEAFAKALGKGFRHGVSFSDIEVVRDSLGKPFIKLSGKTGDFFRQTKARRIHLSISHEESHSLAVVIIES